MSFHRLEGIVPMKGRRCALFGVAGPLLAYVFIAISIGLSPWFRWERNALSDLGHAVRSSVAPLYNFGLLLGGLLLAIYAVTTFRSHARWTSYSLVLSAFSLQLVAVFDEVYGFFHFAVSVLFFASLAPASILYFVEKKSRLALTSLAIGLASWILYWMKVYRAGVAVPETISSVAATAWVVYSALKIYIEKQNSP